MDENKSDDQYLEFDSQKTCELIEGIVDVARKHNANLLEFLHALHILETTVKSMMIIGLEGSKELIELIEKKRKEDEAQIIKDLSFIFENQEL